MLERGKTSPLRAFFLVALCVSGEMTSDSGAKGQPWGWLIFAAGAVLSALFVLAAFQKIQRIQAVSGVSAAMLCLSALIFCGRETRIFVRFLMVNELNSAGEWGNSLLMLGVLTVLTVLSGRELETLVWLTAPMVFACYAVSFCLTVPQADWSDLLLSARTAEVSISPILHTLFAVLLPAVFPIACASSGNSLGKAPFALGASAGMLALCAMSMRNLLVLGDPALRLFRYPSYSAANAFRHGEVLVLCICVLSQALRTGVFLRFMNTAVQDRFPGSQPYLPLLLPLAAVGASRILIVSSETASMVGGGLILAALMLPLKKQA